MKIINQDQETDLILCRSPESRCLRIAELLLERNPRLTRIFVFHFKEYDHGLGPSPSSEESETHTEYWRNAHALDAILQECGAQVELISTSFDDSACGCLTDARLGTAKQLVVDASCIPRMQLAALTLHLVNAELSYRSTIAIGYTHAEDYRKDEASFSIGVAGFGSVQGLSGRIRHEENVALIVAGFEGNRALSAFKRIDPVSAHVLFGGIERDDLRSIAVRNNHQMLSNDRVTWSVCNSFDPVQFLSQAVGAIRSLRHHFPLANLCLVPLGTKVQTIASVLMNPLWPEMQFFFTHPTTRRLRSIGSGTTVWFDLKGLAFAAQRIAIGDTGRTLDDRRAGE